jgi:hypothetical protein
MSDFDVQQVREAAADVLSVHRWKSMGVASVECECGEILYGNDRMTQFPADEAFRKHLADAAMAVIVPAVTAQIRALHKAVHLTFSWKDGIRAEEPCEVCGGKAGGDRECGCWGDVDRDLYCLSCSDLSGHTSHHAVYPCPTVLLCDQIDAAVRGEGQ